MTIEYVDPSSGILLRTGNGALVGDNGARFPVLEGVPRFVENQNYVANFGFQWNEFRTIQIDDETTRISSERFWKETRWRPEALTGEKILEVGSGAGRFTEVVMRETSAELASIDYSDAVSANLANNAQYVEAGRLTLAQANLYEMPFADGYFDRAFCFGVLQHTPNFRGALEAIVRKIRPGGELVVDFYPVKGWWTKINAKYLLRPITKRIPDATLLRIIRATAPTMIRLYRGLKFVGMGAMTRFLPVVDIDSTEVANAKREVFTEMVVAHTFDMFSPEYDSPQRITTVADWLSAAGMSIEFAGFVEVGTASAAVVRSRKR